MKTFVGRYTVGGNGVRTGECDTKSIRVGGDEIDSAIVNYMKRAYNLMIGERTAEEIRADEVAAFKQTTKNQVMLLTIGGAALLAVGAYAPASFMQHFIVFVLSVFVGFQVIWNVSHSLHTPLMAITNAISSIIILGAILQIGSSSFLVTVLAGISVFFAGINIFGGFLVTRRMLAMFQKS